MGGEFFGNEMEVRFLNHVEAPRPPHPPPCGIFNSPVNAPWGLRVVQSPSTVASTWVSSHGGDGGWIRGAARRVSARATRTAGSFCHYRVGGPTASRCPRLLRCLCAGPPPPVRCRRPGREPRRRCGRAGHGAGGPSTPASAGVWRIRNRRRGGPTGGVFALMPLMSRSHARPAARRDCLSPRRHERRAACLPEGAPARFQRVPRSCAAAPRL